MDPKVYKSSKHVDGAGEQICDSGPLFLASLKEGFCGQSTGSSQKYMWKNKFKIIPILSNWGAFLGKEEEEEQAQEQEAEEEHV